MVSFAARKAFGRSGHISESRARSGGVSREQVFFTPPSLSSHRGPRTDALLRKHEFREVIELIVRQVGRDPVRVVRVERPQDVAHGERPAVVQVGRRPPALDQAGRIELLVFVEILPLAYVVLLLVGEVWPQMARAAIRFLEDRRAAPGGLAQRPVHEVRTGDGFQTLQIFVDRLRVLLGDDGELNEPEARTDAGLGVGAHAKRRD